MTTSGRAIAGSILFFLLAPGVVVGLVPWLLTRWQLREVLPYWGVARVVGVVLIVGGLIPTIAAFVQFARSGGTPAPVLPTTELVVTGPNRYLRNPMYASLLVVLIGQALLFGSGALVVYAAAAWAVTAAFVRWYEEPTLLRQFGGAYEEYRRRVPAWYPRWPRRAD